MLLYLIIGLVAGLLAGLAAGYFWKASQLNQDIEKAVASHSTVLELRNRLQEAAQEMKSETQRLQTSLMEQTRLKEQLAQSEMRLASQQEELKSLQKQFATEFENLANRIFEDKSKKFQQENKDQLDVVLRPFRDKLTDFETKVEKVYKEENNERIHLKAEIKLLSDLNKQLSNEANNLAEALKGSNKQQGNWGEMILEKILERSGLQSGVEYETQTSDVNSDGRTIRPDVVVHLPDQKHIIIDSKVSLIAYNQMIAAETDEDRARHLKLHIESIRSHIKLLSEKNYSSAQKLTSPDFVLLFMPIEAAFSSAMQQDSDLYNFAWDKKVVLVSPTTLLATLRTVASIWKQEKRTRNAEEIASEAGKLYDKFVGFVEDLVDVGKRMESAKSSYDGAMKKLVEGTGNLVNRAEKMKKLGAKAEKSIDSRIIDRAQSNEELPL